MGTLPTGRVRLRSLAAGEPACLVCTRSCTSIRPVLPVEPRYTARTVRIAPDGTTGSTGKDEGYRAYRGWYAYGVRTVRGKLPYASGTYSYSTQEADGVARTARALGRTCQHRVLPTP